MLRTAIAMAILAVVLYLVFQTYLLFGYARYFHKHHPGQCQRIKGLNYGSEDLDVTSTGQTFITSGISIVLLPQEYKDFLKANNIRGRIFLYDFNTPDLGAVELKIQGNLNTSTFRPHGLSLLEDKIKGEHLIYVINHAETEDSNDRVEKFRFLPEKKELLHLKSFTSDRFYITNDLALVKEDKFYISNYLYYKNKFLSLIEQGLSVLSLGSVVFFNGTHGSEVVPGIHGPNGITLSKDLRFLYVNMPFFGTMQVYERSDKDNSLSLIQTVNLHTGGDNFFLTPNGDMLYTGAHPIVYKAMDHLNNPSDLAPSSVLRLPLRNGKVLEERINEVFYDHGDLISASSIAAIYNGKLIIGSIIDKLVVCDTRFSF